MAPAARQAQHGTGTRCPPMYSASSPFLASIVMSACRSQPPSHSTGARCLRRNRSSEQTTRSSVCVLQHTTSSIDQNVKSRGDVFGNEIADRAEDASSQAPRPPSERVANVSNLPLRPGDPRDSSRRRPRRSQSDMPSWPGWVARPPNRCELRRGIRPTAQRRA